MPGMLQRGDATSTGPPPCQLTDTVRAAAKRKARDAYEPGTVQAKFAASSGLPLPGRYSTRMLSSGSALVARATGPTEATPITTRNATTTAT